MMRRARMLGHGYTFYHLISRVNHREYLLDAGEKERLVHLLREAEAFGCGDVVTYCVLDNHFHCLVGIDHDADVPEALVVERVRGRYGEDRAKALLHELAVMRENSDEEAAQALLDRYRLRMNNLAEFAKDVLQRFTMSYNRRHDCIGRFWSDRYKSAVVEGLSKHDSKALASVAAYIDLNPVRAGVVTDPAAYRFCGYGAAAGGDQLAVSGLSPVLAMITKGAGATLAAYRGYIFRQGFDHSTEGSRSEAFRRIAKKVVEKEGRLNPAELVFCRVRYFSDGLAIGSRNFIEDLFVRNRHLFSEKRKNGARTLRNADSDGLYCMRDLRRDPISPPACASG